MKTNKILTVYALLIGVLIVIVITGILNLKDYDTIKTNDYIIRSAIDTAVHCNIFGILLALALIFLLAFDAVGYNNKVKQVKEFKSKIAERIKNTVDGMYKNKSNTAQSQPPSDSRSAKEIMEELISGKLSNLNKDIYERKEVKEEMNWIDEVQNTTSNYKDDGPTIPVNNLSAKPERYDYPIGKQGDIYFEEDLNEYKRNNK